MSLHSETVLCLCSSSVDIAHKYQQFCLLRRRHSCWWTYTLPTILLLLFRQLPAELAEQHSTIFGYMVGSMCNLKMHVRNLGHPFSLQIGSPKPPFLTILQLKGNFNGLYLQNETGYIQAGKCVANYKESPTLFQNHMNFGPQTASNWR